MSMCHLLEIMTMSSSEKRSPEGGPRAILANLGSWVGKSLAGSGPLHLVRPQLHQPIGVIPDLAQSLGYRGASVETSLGLHQNGLDPSTSQSRFSTLTHSQASKPGLFTLWQKGFPQQEWQTPDPCNFQESACVPLIKPSHAPSPGSGAWPLSSLSQSHCFFQQKILLFLNNL